MKRVKRITIVFFLCLILIRAEENYLDYTIPTDADKSGPVETRVSKLTFTRYYRKGSNKLDRKSLLAVEYHFDGLLNKRELYKEGKLHGIQMSWHRNGTIQVKAPYMNGLRHGVFEHWNDNGQLIGKYVMNQGTGRVMIFDENGYLKSLDSYVANMRTGLYIEQDFRLWSLSFIRHKDDKMVGTAFGFHKLDQLRSITTFSSEGKYHGLYIRYNRDDTLGEMFLFLNGSKVGKQEYLNARKHDESLPPYFEDAQKYREYYSKEIQNCMESYKAIEIVKIPMKFNDDGSIVTVSGKPLVLPK